MSDARAFEAPILALESVACGHGKRTVLSNVTFSMRRGDFLCLLGPNGVGKTTLFRTILRLLPLHAGRILLLGEDVADLDITHFAQRVAYVPQAHIPPFAYRVIDVVAMGRTAHLGAFDSPSARDMRIAEEQLEALGIARLQDAAYTELSGGERQLVLVARALAQQPSLLVLDEPTSNLDYGNQVALMDQVRDLAHRSGVGVIMTTHDPNVALRYGTRVVTIARNGTVLAAAPAEAITEDYLLDTYGVRSYVVDLGGELLCYPVRAAAGTRRPRARPASHGN